MLLLFKISVIPTQEVPSPIWKTNKTIEIIPRIKEISPRITLRPFEKALKQSTDFFAEQINNIVMKIPIIIPKTPTPNATQYAIGI